MKHIASFSKIQKSLVSQNLKVVIYHIIYFTERNIALGKPAFQSSEGWNGKAER